ncbi:hypothetical protein CVT25_007669, partial [Psilocybe cyanescens]
MASNWNTDIENNIKNKFINAKRIFFPTALDVSANLVDKDDTLILESGGVDYVVQSVVTAVLDYAAKGYLDRVADHTKGVYATNTEIYGCTYLSHSNHAIGHPHVPSTPSGSLIKGCSNFVAGMDLLRKLAPLARCANCLIKTVDKDCFREMEDLQRRMITRSAHVQAICT